MLEQFLRDSDTWLAQGRLWVLGVALVAGVLASAVCPCTVPVGMGVAGAAGASEQHSRRSGLAIALFFFVGIVVNLTVLGALAGQLGALLSGSFGRYWTLSMAVLSLTAACVVFAGPRLGTSRLASLRRPGMLGAFSYGFIFSMGTSAAPLLVLLTYAAVEAEAVYGMVLAFSFGLGRGLPFLLAGLFAGAVLRLARLSLMRRPLQYIGGFVLLFVAAYFTRAFVALL